MTGSGTPASTNPVSHRCRKRCQSTHRTSRTVHTLEGTNRIGNSVNTAGSREGNQVQRRVAYSGITIPCCLLFLTTRRATAGNLRSELCLLWKRDRTAFPRRRASHFSALEIIIAEKESGASGNQRHGISRNGVIRVTGSAWTHLPPNTHSPPPPLPDPD